MAGPAKRVDARVCLGAVTGAHGVRGALKVKSFTAEPGDIAAYGPLFDEAESRRFELRIVGRSGGQLVMMVDGVTDRTAAEALKGTRLYVARDKLPAPSAEEFYHADLIGLQVEDLEGAPLGTVRGVHDFGAGDLLDILSADGEELLVPFTKAVVPVVDIEAGRIVVDPPIDTPDDPPVDPLDD